MIVLSLAGNSNRFFIAGYTTVKYLLPLQGKPVILHILNWIPRDIKILIVLNEKYNDVVFIKNLLNSLSFRNFRVVEVDDTLGQSDTVYRGLCACPDFWVEQEELIIFNGDTIRKSVTWNFGMFGNYIEVFKGQGTHWSFVDDLGLVQRVEEKVRISEYCSDGLYTFESIMVFLRFFELYKKKLTSELYVAPIYNLMIIDGYAVHSGVIDQENLVFCGTPDEYERAVYDNG